MLKCTFNSSIKVRVSGHFEAGVGHQEAGDVGEARMDMFAHILQLFVLVLGDLRHTTDTSTFLKPLMMRMRRET